jgi:DNA repair protein RecN (Recombination protein N)
VFREKAHKEIKMLQSLHVKNLALMEETEVEFGSGLNILTGETGAGKSLLIGSVSLALGGKFEKEMLRKGAEYCSVELTFSDKSRTVSDKLKSMELYEEEDGCIIISRRMQIGKNVYRINGETVTAKQVKELAELLIDIHGQHEHQSLIHKKKHMEILDEYGKEEAAKALHEVQEHYRQCSELRAKLEAETKDDASKAKEQSLAEFELKEIEDAALSIGEDESLEQQYRLMVNSRKIAENLSESYQMTGSDMEDSAGSMISRALRSLGSITMYDDRLSVLEGQLAEIENLLSDYNKDVSEYISQCDFDREDFERVENRLNIINRLKGKYGNTVEEILKYADERRMYLDKLNDYDSYIAELNADYEETRGKLEKACEKLSKIRVKNADKLQKLLIEALQGLNFLTVQFEIAVRPGQNITSSGYDDVEFMISTNPGEPLMPISQVASGGELSRIMLAIKTVLAGRDEIDTLIFDEIDTGISGKTAWKVSEQLDTVARAHQVICITHLPQIASMADRHFAIEKSSTESSTITDIRRLDENESLSELARLLGSDELSSAALENARQMREQALEHKKCL